jgi:integrase
MPLPERRQRPGRKTPDHTIKGAVADVGAEARQILQHLEAADCRATGHRFLGIFKAGEARHVRMNDVVISALQSIPRMLHNPCVFRSLIPGENFKNGPRNWKRYLADAGIENFRWHDLSHTFASRLVMRGVDLYTVSKLFGHHNLEMTQRYAHLAPEHLQKAVDVLIQTAPKPAPGISEQKHPSAKLL